MSEYPVFNIFDSPNCSKYLYTKYIFVGCVHSGCVSLVDVSVVIKRCLFLAVLIF